MTDSGEKEPVLAKKKVAVAKEKSKTPKAATKAAAKPVKAAKPKAARKSKKSAYPLLSVTDEAGTVTRTKLKAVPTDHDPKLHFPLKRDDFETDSLFLLYRASLLEKNAAKLRKQAEFLQAGGGDKAKQKKLLKLAKMMEKVNEMKSDLEIEGELPSFEM